MEFHLIQKKLSNTLSAEEKREFDHWFKESPDHRAYFHKIKSNYTADSSVDTEKSWEKVLGRIRRKERKIFSWQKWGVAASILLLLGLSLPFFLSDQISAPPSENHTIEIGKSKAILTLSDGSELSLGEGQENEVRSMHSHFAVTGNQIVYNKSVDNIPVEYNYLTIPRGGQFFLILGDSTKVWLNSDSKIKYPVQFPKGKPRVVHLLRGEAFFDVSPKERNEGTSFKVETRDQTIAVLGTQFNIKAYEGEAITTTLVEGKIGLKVDNNNATLLPNQQAVYDLDSGQIQLNDLADTYDYTAWRRGFFGFKNTSLKEIMKVISRWYDVDVKFTNKKIETIEFNGVLSKKQEIENILKIISKTNNITYEIKKRTIYLK